MIVTKEYTILIVDKLPDRIRYIDGLRKRLTDKQNSTIGFVEYSTNTIVLLQQDMYKFRMETIQYHGSR